MTTMTKTKTMMMGGAALTLLLAACAAEPGLPLGSIDRPLSAIKVAAVQYGEGDYAQVDTTCGAQKAPDFCAVQAMITQAQAKGATLVVTPENELGQLYYEPDPELGQIPAQEPGLADDSMIKKLSKQAQQLKIYLVVHLATIKGSGSGAKKYSTQVAFDPSGKIVGKHHKFELYSGEKKTYTPGTDVSAFTSPAGKVGLLICADIYGDPRLSDKLTRTLGARLLAFSTWWTVSDATRWQANFARNWGVYVVAANTTYGAGRGGGVFGPDGKAIDLKNSGKPELAMASIPATP
jgi:predicted amidohydrolase